ncbi:MAG: ArdC-like ssDNA-binding domain-containing protein [Thermoleophilia bacterium]
MTATARRNSRRKPTDEQIADRAAKVEALTEQLHAAVLDLTSSEAWLALLAVASRFPTYSWRNQVLLAVQAADRGMNLSRVAGFNRWRQLGRIVRRGEKGLAILAPVRRRLSAQEAAKRHAEHLPGYDRDGRPIIVVRGFRIEHVFDQSQTEQIPGAQQLPEPRPWVAQRGQGPAGLWDAICALITAAGYEIEHRPPVGADATSHGWTDGHRKIVWIRSDVNEAEQIRVAIHELAHIRADHLGDDDSGRDISRAQRETEADSIAHVVASWAGLDVAASAVEYVAGWSGGDAEILEAALSAIHQAATSIIADLDAELDAALDTGEGS